MAMTPDHRPGRFSNRSIILGGLALCIAAAIVVAYLLGIFDSAATPG